jgi:hypothetical protein
MGYKKDFFGGPCLNQLMTPAREFVIIAVLGVQTFTQKVKGPFGLAEGPETNLRTSRISPVRLMGGHIKIISFR